MITYQEMKERYAEDAETTQNAIDEIKIMGSSSESTKPESLIQDMMEYGFIVDDKPVSMEKALEIGRSIGGKKAVYLLESISCDLSRFLDHSNPIKPNTKIRILSPEHSEYVQKLAFEAGFSFEGGKFDEDFKENPYWFFWADMKVCWGLQEEFIDDDGYEQIHIPLPENISAKILAEKVTAAQILEAGLGHMRDRAVTYDNESGERSMSATVEAFNAITGHQLTEEQGWHFMTLLKLVRSQQGATKLDNYEDGAAYFGLAGEAAMRGAK